MCLANVYSFLDDTAKQRQVNHEEALNLWEGTLLFLLIYIPSAGSWISRILQEGLLDGHSDFHNVYNW